MEITAATRSLKALGDPNRLAIFRLLVTTGPAGCVVGQIAEHLQIAPATLSFHLKALVQADLIRPERSQRFIRYRADYDTMNSLIGYLTENCCQGHPERCAPGADQCEPPSHAA